VFCGCRWMKLLVRKKFVGMVCCFSVCRMEVMLLVFVLVSNVSVMILWVVGM